MESSYDVYKYLMTSKLLVISKMSNIYIIRLRFKNILTSIWHLYDVSFQSYRRLCFHIGKYVMTSKYTPWRQNIRHDVKIYAMTSNYWSYLKCQMQSLFAFISRICWHQSNMCTMFRPRVIDEYVFFTFLVTLTFTFDLYPWYLSTLLLSHTAITVHSCVTIGHHLTNLWCEYSAADTHNYIHKQTHKHQHYNNFA